MVKRKGNLQGHATLFIVRNLFYTYVLRFQKIYIIKVLLQHLTIKLIIQPGSLLFRQNLYLFDDLNQFSEPHQSLANDTIFAEIRLLLVPSFPKILQSNLTQLELDLAMRNSYIYVNTVYSTISSYSWDISYYT